jgi:FMN phosphatase YigB (HAD superfamily)
LARFSRRYRDFDLTTDTRRELDQIFGKIYTTPLKFLEGAENGLAFVKKTGVPFGIVTHANRTWIWEKYNWLGLQRFFPWDNVYIVDEDGHKTPRSWAQAAAYFGQNLGHCLIVGNSPRSDINPAIAAGARPENCVLVADPKLWTIHRQEVQPGVIRIQNLSQLSESRFPLVRDVPC